MRLAEVARRARTYDAYLDDLAITSRAESDVIAQRSAGFRNRTTKRLPLHGADRS